MTDPLLSFARSTRSTPQSQPIPGSSAPQVQNSAGGYVFQVDDWTRLHRFLILGVEGGTYYASAPDLTRENATLLLNLLQVDGPRVADHIRQVSVDASAPRQQPLLFALALAAASNDETSHAAFAVLPEVCRTATQLFMFNSYLEQLRGWGRARKRAVGAWYLDPKVEDVAYQAIKYRNREGWTHRDLLRSAHPHSSDPARRALFEFILGYPSQPGLVPLLDSYREVNDPHTSLDRTVELIRLHRLPWEALPEDVLGFQTVWDALLGHLGLTALLRQLPRLTRLGLIAPFRPLDPRLRRLADPDQLRKARIHPVQVLNALFGYRSGSGRSGASWVPDPKVIDLLEDSFQASFGAVDPANRRTLVSLDVSSSMTWSTLALLPALTPAQVAAAMAMVTIRTEPECLVTAFSHRLTPLPITPRSSLSEVVRIIDDVSMGRTDCALPFMWANSGHVEVDTFVTFTDNETWYGSVHPTQALRDYRQASGLSARSAVSAMTSTGFSIADPDDQMQLDLVGFDAAAPRLLAEFSGGRL